MTHLLSSPPISLLLPPHQPPPLFCKSSLVSPSLPSHLMYFLPSFLPPFLPSILSSFLPSYKPSITSAGIHKHATDRKKILHLFIIFNILTLIYFINLFISFSSFGLMIARRVVLITFIIWSFKAITLI